MKVWERDTVFVTLKRETKRREKRGRDDNNESALQNSCSVFMKQRGFQKVNLNVTQQRAIKRPTERITATTGS